jgi:hypothetical protein
MECAHDILLGGMHPTLLVWVTPRLTLARFRARLFGIPHVANCLSQKTKLPITTSLTDTTSCETQSVLATVVLWGQGWDGGQPFFNLQ